MSQPFPVDPFFVGNYAPLTFEADAPDLPLRGALPKNLAAPQRSQSAIRAATAVIQNR